MSRRQVGDGERELLFCKFHSPATWLTIWFAQDCFNPEGLRAGETP